MKEFQSLAAFQAHIEKLIVEFPIYEKKAANFLGEILVKEARDKIGHLQEGWKELADSTKSDKERKGYVFNADYNPLYRTGQLRDSIHHVFNIQSQTLFIGSDSEIMEYQEKGTKYIPARPVLSTTVYQAHPVINYVFGSMLKQYVSGEPLTLRKGTYGSL
jgi:hypothetical protein